jgi:hypothetical protein
VHHALRAGRRLRTRQSSRELVRNSSQFAAFCPPARSQMAENAGNEGDERRMETMKLTNQQRLPIDTQIGKLTHTQPVSVDLIRGLIRRLQLEGSTRRGDDLRHPSRLEDAERRADAGL